MISDGVESWSEFQWFPNFYHIYKKTTTICRNNTTVWSKRDLKISIYLSISWVWCASEDHFGDSAVFVI